MINQLPAKMTSQLPMKFHIVKNSGGHIFSIGEKVAVFREFSNGTLDAVRSNGDCSVIHLTDIINKKEMKQMTEAVIDTAKKLCQAQNKVTTLEIKAEVIKTHPSYFWTQAFVSATMDDAYNEGCFIYHDTTTGPNVHRVYSLVGQPQPVQVTVSTAPKVKKLPAVKAPKAKNISKSKALELMENNRGHFFTVTFVKKEGDLRIMNCQYLKDQAQSKLGYVRVKENIISKKLKNADKSVKKNETGIRSINMQTLLELKIAGGSYTVK